MRLTITQKSIAICTFLFIMLGGSTLITYQQINSLSKLEQQALESIGENSKFSLLVGDAIHNTTKMASSFKNVILRGDNSDALSKHKKEFVKFREAFTQNIEDMQSLQFVQNTDEAKQLVNQWLSQFNETANKYQKQIDNFEAGIPDLYKTLDKAVSGIDRPVVATGKTAEEFAQKSLAETSNAFAEENHQAFNQILLNLLLISGVTLGVLFTCLWLFTRSVKTALGAEPDALANIASRLAHGDLSMQFPQKLQANSVISSLNHMKQQLTHLIGGIRNKSEQLDDAIVNIQHQLSTVDEAAQKQSEASASMASAIEEMSASVAQLLEAANQTTQSSEDSRLLTIKGLGVVVDSSNDVKETASGAEKLSHTVQELGEQSKNISQIISVIEEIAGQTNLLALNAAIEAARAGEQGRGFAVVADEVRRLAERTTESTSEIEQMVSTIQNDTQLAVGEMNSWASKVSGNLARMDEAKNTMASIQELANRVKQLAVEVSESLSEQRSAANQMSTQVERLAAQSEENASSVGSIRQTVQHLTELSTHLKEDSAKFKLA